MEFPKKNWGLLLLTRGHFQGSMMFHVKLKESNLRKGSMHNPSRCNWEVTFWTNLLNHGHVAMEPWAKGRFRESCFRVRYKNLWPQCQDEVMVSSRPSISSIASMSSDQVRCEIIWNDVARRCWLLVIASKYLETVYSDFLHFLQWKWYNDLVKCLLFYSAAFFEHGLLLLESLQMERWMVIQLSRRHLRMAMRGCMPLKQQRVRSLLCWACHYLWVQPWKGGRLNSLGRINLALGWILFNASSHLSPAKSTCCSL